MNSIQQLEDWLNENRDDLDNRGFSVNLVECEPTDNSAAYFDIDTKSMVARATIWESMEINLEAMEVESGKEVIAENHRAADWPDIIRLLNDFFSRLS